MHNLISFPEKKQRRKEYLMRLATVFLCAWSIALAVGCASLVPVYLYVNSERSLVREEGATLDALVAGDGAEAPKDTLVRTSTVVSMLTALSKKTLVSDITRAALEERPDGVIIHSLRYTRRDNNLTLEGTADRRDQIVTYSRKLEDKELFTSAQLPIGDLAKSTNLRWRMTLTLSAPTPAPTPTPNP